MNTKSLKVRVEDLESKGVVFVQPFSQSDLKRNPGKLASAESEISVVEQVGIRLGRYQGIKVEPGYAPPTDVDISFGDQDWEFSLQVKTFEFWTSKYLKRISEAVKDWDSKLPVGQNAYVARTYRGSDVVSEEVRPVRGMSRLARAGSFSFEPTKSDFLQMRSKVADALSDASRQLVAAPGLRVVVFDIRHSYIDSHTLYTETQGKMRIEDLARSIDAVAMLTYDFDRPPKAHIIFAVLWVHPLKNRAVSLFRPPHPIHLVYGRPFAMPLHVYHDKPGWQDLFTLERGTIKIDDVAFGPAPGMQ